MKQKSVRQARAIRVAIILSLAASSVTYVHGARGIASTPASPPQPGGAPQAFAADVRVRHSRTVPGGSSPISLGLAFHVERMRSGADWTTRLTLTEITGNEAPSVDGTVLDNPFLVTRVEVEDGGSVRLFNRRGERVREPGRADRERLGLPPRPDPLAGWMPGGQAPSAVAALADDVWSAEFATPDHVERRRRALEASFGPPVEQRNGFIRHVRTAGDEVTEALVDRVLAVPVEVVTRRAGVLVSRTTLALDQDAKGLLRKRLRSERGVPGQNGELDLLDVEVTRAEVREGGGR